MSILTRKLASLLFCIFSQTVFHLHLHVSHLCHGNVFWPVLSLGRHPRWSWWWNVFKTPEWDSAICPLQETERSEIYSFSTHSLKWMREGIFGVKFTPFPYFTSSSVLTHWSEKHLEWNLLQISNSTSVPQTSPFYHIVQPCTAISCCANAYP